jgi:hypothetical protein
MQPTTDPGDRLVCAVLAAQVAELRARVDAGATVELLWRSSDLLSKLSALVTELTDRCCDAALTQQCNETVATALEIRQSIEEAAFAQAQRTDLTCQTIDCIAVALDRLAVTDARDGPRLSPDDLAALYVSEQQRKIHHAVAVKFAAAGSAGRDDAAIRVRERRGE